MRILVVEDNPDLARLITRALCGMNHAVDTLDDGSMAVTALATEPYDLIVLDLTLPGKDGLEVLKEYRGQGGRAPVFILTARAELDARVQGLDLGADDYLIKPFELAEFEARVRALLRRRADRRTPVIRAGELTFHTVRQTVAYREIPIELTPRTRGVLEILMRHADHVVSKEQIFSHLFGFDDEADISAIEIYISRLRKRLTETAISIRTIRGLGYVLVTR